MKDEVTMVLTEAAQKLRALGVHCAIGPLSLPQGYSLNLHVGESPQATAAAFVAVGMGGVLAHAADSANSFASEVATVLATDAIDKAARPR